MTFRIRKTGVLYSYSLILLFFNSNGVTLEMSPAPKPTPNILCQKLVMPEEDRRAHPTASSWDGGFRWFRSANVVDLQQYRSPAEKERIRAVLLCWPTRVQARPVTQPNL